ncbi:uroporphyrinogen decarboxylase family protein [Opitutus sp. ER46]|uniref:uroporphyrinogen decarboxylase family protein n=1 Tax=Opitutus sp. ER46 TaxID=2161864 RepID=UPI000D321782|nr:uroporphyrinogen decarboxylase family protein [Opitutus sp. ER46]PTY00370.1 methyltransferase [Opitutus sp. ER46]
MTPRERILASIAHREPDRVPVDLGATPSSGISAVAYNRLRAHLGLKAGSTRVYDVVQQLAQPEDVILDRYGIDVVDLGRTFNARPSDWYDVSLWDGSRAEYPAWFRPELGADGAYRARHADGTEIAIQLPGMNFYDQTCFPWIDGYPDDLAGLPAAMGKVHWAALAHSPWDAAAAPDFWARLRANALHLRATTDRAIMVVVGCNLFEWGTFLRRMDNFLMDLAAEPEQVERLVDALVEIHLETLRKVCTAVGDIADVCRFGDDLGMDTGPFMSAAMYRRLFKSRHARMCEYVHRHSSMHTFLHSCGSIHALLPDLIEAGFEVINPVQTACRDMEPERLKAEFGKDVTFWGGGADTRAILNHGTPAQVRDDVRRRVDILAPGGGFVFNTIHNILPDVPPENIEAMFAALHGGGTTANAAAPRE